MSKYILYQEKARIAIERGMGILGEAVALTLGPKGRNVVLEKKFGVPQIINDGVTIAKEIELKDHIENTGVALIRQAAAKTNDVAGDGTTTATVLAYEIVKQGMKNVAAGANPISLKRGIEKATKFLINQISEYAEPVEDLNSIAQVASISAGNDKTVGEMISNAMEKVGKRGIITIDEGKTTNTELEITEGLQFDKGFISPYFVTDHKQMQVTYENAYVLLTDRKITLVQQDLVPLLEQISKTGQPLLIIAEDIEKEALATLVVNKLRGILNIVAVRAPSFGDTRKLMLEDIAILTGGKVISESVGLNLNTIQLEMLGKARLITVTKNNTTVIATGNEELIRGRCNQLQRQIQQSTVTYEKEKLQERLAKLAGGVAIIKVGAATETEMKDKKLRLEDAVNATKAAIEEGIVPGGGATLTHLSKELNEWAKENLVEDELVGALIVEKSLTAPLRRIAENAGQNGSLVIEKVKENDFNTGFNAATGEFVDMYDIGVVDPAKVTRTALQNATSIAAMVLTTECIIVDKQKRKK
jgi:chaperonin GroEL|tara:strand:- start:226 stop:1818 length:1593 start_codon:yes stop_codon:yes gene_type:complete